MSALFILTFSPHSQLWKLDLYYIMSGTNVLILSDSLDRSVMDPQMTTSTSNVLVSCSAKMFCNVHQCDLLLLTTLFTWEQTNHTDEHFSFHSLKVYTIQFNHTVYISNWFLTALVTVQVFIILNWFYNGFKKLKVDI